MHSKPDQSRRPRPNTVRLIAAAATSVASLALAGCTVPQPPQPPPSSSQVTLADTAYPIPAGALFVATSGSDNNAGSSDAPFATLQKAIDSAWAGTTIVMRGGTYREGGVQRFFKRLTIQPYPHEKVWIKGTDVVTGFRRAGANGSQGVWVKDGWSHPFCDCADALGIDPKFPTAGMPDEVFLNGAPRRQVEAANGSCPVASVVAGTFCVDDASHQLYVGDDPTAATVEASTQSTALTTSQGAAGSVIRGLGFAGYATAWQHGMVVADSPGMVIENNTFAYSASAGLLATEPKETINGNLFIDNGFVGLQAWQTNYSTVSNNRFAYNNNEHFRAGTAVSGEAGLKMSGTTGAWITSNIFEDNDASGFWADVSSSGLQIVRNVARNNTGVGLFYEVSGFGVIASNLVESNAVGIQAGGANDTRIYNNTLVDNGLALNVYGVNRSNPDSAKVAAGITWVAVRDEVVNNLVFDAVPSSPAYQVKDYASPARAATAIVSMSDDNAWYQRAAPNVVLAEWWLAKPGQHWASAFGTLAGLQAGTGRELHSHQANSFQGDPFFQDSQKGDFRLRAGSPYLHGGQPLPANVAAALGVMAGTPIGLGALDWPGR